MNIEIHRPELEALINQRMASGHFKSIEDVLLQALESSPEIDKDDFDLETAMGERLIAAMQASPYKDTEIEPSRFHMPVRDVKL